MQPSLMIEITRSQAAYNSDGQPADLARVHLVEFHRQKKIQSKTRKPGRIRGLMLPLLNVCALMFSAIWPGTHKNKADLTSPADCGYQT